MASELVAALTAGHTPEQLAAMRDDNHDVEVYTVAIVFSLLAVAAVGLRVTSRHLKSGAVVGVDDALVIAALVFKLPPSCHPFPCRHPSRCPRVERRR